MPDTSQQLIQCVPNFSEGRNSGTLEQIADVLSGCNVRLVDWSADFDHNRSVFTILGNYEGILASSLAVAGTVISLIDINMHKGVHPRLGVLDVLPFVPLIGATMDDCVILAIETGREIAERYAVPVFLYDFASPARSSLPAIRKSAFVSLFPDFGPSLPHPTAGAVAVGARGPMIAFNVNLSGGSLADAKRIAREVRLAFPSIVRALGMALPSRGVAQVSMNIIQPHLVGMVELIQFIESRHAVLESELIGVLPGFSAREVVQDALRLSSLKPGQVILETWKH